MRRISVLMLLVTVLIGMLLPAGTSAQAACPAGFIQTTPGNEGVPNLFRLGLKYGVSWTRIILPSGALPVPERIFPNTVVCVPTGGTVTVIVVVNPAAPSGATATPVPAPPTVFNPIDEYCRGVPTQGVPDRGSCLMEAQAIAFGSQRVVESGIKCTPREVAQRNGSDIQCNVFGTAWLSVQAPVPPAATPFNRIIKVLAYNGVGHATWLDGWGFVTFQCVNSPVKGYVAGLDFFAPPAGLLATKVTFLNMISAFPDWSEGEARGEAQSRGFTSADPAACP